MGRTCWKVVSVKKLSVRKRSAMMEREMDEEDKRIMDEIDRERAELEAGGRK